VPNVKVYLYKDGVNTGRSATTDSNGHYLFDNLEPGNYHVVFDLNTLPVGYVVSPQDRGNDNRDSDANPSTGATARTTLAPGENDPSWDMGINQPYASIGDRVWYDTNRDGVQDAGETGVQGVRVTLVDASGNNMGTTTTDSNGYYLFDSLEPGNYHVVFDLNSLPEGYVISPKDQGSDDTKDSDADMTTGATIETTLTAGENDPTWDMGVYELGSLHGNVSHENQSGLHPIKDVTLILLDEQGHEIARTKTDAQGDYAFTHLEAGDYIVKEIQPSGYFDVRENEGGDDNDNPLSTGENEISATVGVGEHDTHNDFVEAQESSLGDYVWYDDDADGIQDANEKGVEGVTVKLLDAEGNTVGTTTTDSKGAYLFEHLDPNKAYIVAFDTATLPKGYEITSQNESGNDAKDSDADAQTGKTPAVTLKPGEHNPTIDMGIHRVGATPEKPYLIGTHFWIDKDKDGEFNHHDVPIGGALVELLNENGEPVLGEDGEPVTTHTSTEEGHVGEYHFDVPEGTYGVRFHIPEGSEYEGYIFGKPKENSDNGDNINTANEEGYTQIVEVGPDTRAVDLTLDGGVECECDGAPIHSNGGDALGTLSMLLMALMTLLSGLYFVRRDVQREGV
jgi:protocatechuate 3,4-dioxygenase beta subunit